MSKIYRIPGKIFRYLHRIIPKTHELGGYLKFNENNVASGMELFTGKVCRDASGRILDESTACEVSFPQKEVCFHTHPLANRPSSDDFMNCLHHRITNLHIVISEKGVWLYHARRVENHVENHIENHETLRSELRFLGHYYQTPTQNGNISDYLDNIQTLGFHVKYIPIDEIPSDKMFEFLVE